MRKRSAAVIAGAAALLVTLTGCPPPGDRPWGTVTEVDRDRYAALRDDPVFEGLGVAVHGQPGRYQTPHVQRANVNVETPETDDMESLHGDGLALLDAANGAGWTLYRAECAGSADERDSDWEPPIDAPLRWHAWLYRLTDDQTSLLLHVESIAERDGKDYRGLLRVNAFAPQADEAPNLLPEQPSVVPSPCMRATSVPSADTVQGLDVTFGGSADPDVRPHGPER